MHAWLLTTYTHKRMGLLTRIYIKEKVNNYVMLQDGVTHSIKGNGFVQCKCGKHVLFLYLLFSFDPVKYVRMEEESLEAFFVKVR